MIAAIGPVRGAGATAGSGRMVALDGLRGLAVLLVLVEHFTYNDWVRAWLPGAVGVKTFFVLSGFLITGVLLDARDRSAPLQAARHFFARRMRRLFPAFVLAILAGSILGLGGLLDDWLWHVTYMSNVHVWWQEGWSMAGHFWTLALEQQFYLLWFPVVVMMPRRWLVPVVLGLLIAAPVFRLTMVFGGSPFLDVLLPAQADSLAAGALLALVMRGNLPSSFIAWLIAPPVMWGLILALLTMLALPALGWPRSDFVERVLTPSLIAFAALAVISVALITPQRVSLLTAPKLVWIGTISYGLYIYHYFVPQFFKAYLPFVAEAATLTEKFLRLFAWVVLSVTLAAVSWYMVEKPLLNSRPRPAPQGPRQA